MPPKKSMKRKPPAKKTATQTYVKQVVGRALAPDTDTFYSDGLSFSATTSQSYYDISAALKASTGIGGISCVNKQLVYKGIVNVADNINWVRFIIFKWKPDTASATPTSNDIIRNDASAYAPWGLPHYEKRHQFKILEDKLWSLQSQAAGSVYPTGRQFTIKVSGKKLGVSQYNQGATTGTNHIYFLMVSDSNIASHPVVAGNLRVLYQGDD